VLVTLTTTCAFWAHEAFREDNPRIVPVPSPALQGDLRAVPNPQLVEMRQEVRRVLVNPVGTGRLELLPSVAP
jgi:hypothetical protein